MQDWQNLVSTAEDRAFIAAVLDTAGALVVVLDRQGRIVRFNRACERTTGYSFEEVRGKLLWDLFLIPEEVEPVRAVFEELRAGQFPNAHENYWRAQDGSRRLIAWSNTAILGVSGAVEYVIGTGIDITDRKRAEEALRSAHDKLELSVQERTAELEQANESLQAEISERMRVEGVLRESESHLRSLMESAQHYGVYRIAADPTHPYLARVVLASPSLKELLGTPDPHDLATWFANIHPDDLARCEEANRLSLETGVPFDQQFRVFRPEPGDWHWVHDRSTPVFDATGRLSHFNGLMVDITEQKQTQRALQQRLASEGLLARISTEFVNLGPAEIDTGIEHALQAIGEVSRVDRSYVFQFSGDGTLLDNTHEWCADGIQSYIASLTGLPRATFPWFVGRLEQLEVVSVPRVADMPPEANSERAECEREGIQSIILVPLTYRGMLTGFLGFDSVRSERSWGEDTVALLRTVAGIIVNALEHKRAQAIQAGQRQFLELLATGRDFSETLHSLVRLIEGQWPGMLGLILLLDEDGKHLHIGASVSLPQHYVQSIEGLEIGPMVGSCGTACYERERVIVEDTATDPRWDGLRDLALEYSLRACWSEPVFSPNGQVVGTFAMYYRQPRAPTEAELRAIEMAAHLVGVAIEHRRAEQALRESEAKFRGIVELANVGIAIVLDARFRFVNQHWASMLGYTVEELLGTEFMPYCTPEERNRIVDYYTRRTRGEPAPTRYETVMLHKDGTRVYAEVSVGLIPYEGRQATFVFLRDITEQKRVEGALRQSELRFRAVFEGAPIGISVTSLGPQLLETNRALQQMFGYTGEEFYNLAVSEFSHPEDMVVDAALFDELVLGKRDGYQMEKRFIRKNGEMFWGRLSLSLVRGEQGEPLFAIATTEDITGQKEAQEALQEAYQTLEQRVEERTRELAVLNSIAAVVSGSLDLREIMSAALDRTLGAVDMEFGTAYCVECEPEQAPEVAASSLKTLTMVGPEMVTQIMLTPQDASSLTAEADLLRLLAYRGVSAEYADFVGDVRLPGAAAALARVGRPFVWLVEDTVPADTDFRLSLEREECRQVVTLPLVAKGNLVGAVNLGTRVPRTFSPDQLSLLAAVGQQIGVAVENARLYAAEQERREEAEGRRRVAEGMREILAVLNSRQSLPEMLDFIARQTCRLLGCDAAAILRLEEGLLRIQAAHGLEADYMAGMTMRVGEGGAGRALATRRPVIMSDLAEAAQRTPRTDLPQEMQKEEGLVERLLQQLLEFSAVLSVPLIVQGQDYGAITVYYRTPRAFSDEDLRLAMSVANQVALAVESARLREQAGQAAAMEERGRLARELHDSVTQSLYSVTMYAEAAARLMTSGQEISAAEYLRDARDTAQEALREMRLMIYQLRPPVLEKGGLAVALQVRLDAVERRGGIHAELIVEGQDHLSPAVQAELHQIAQEALNNALKHAHAGEVQVRLQFGDASTYLEVQDDGVGFDVDASRAGGGLGLPGMKERVQKVGGRLHIESAPGQGTKVVVEVPTGGGG